MHPLTKSIALTLLPMMLLAAGCKPAAGPSPVMPSSANHTSITIRGVGLSPRSDTAADFTGFFQKAKDAGDVVMWAGDWEELNAADGGPAVVAGLSLQYGYTPLIEAQFFTQSTGELLRPLDEQTRQAYKTSAAAFTQKYKLKYLGLGLEVNTLYEKSPEDFDAFAGFFSEVYDAVKAASPDTKVFTVFQLEKMKGLNGGLFGGGNNPGNTQWALMDKFPKADMFAFSTYPSLIYKDPAEIPDDYYSDIRLNTDKAIAFTEMGWHTEAGPAGWQSSEAEQSEFVAKFFDLTRSLRAELAVWSFLYDQQTIEPFRSMGLISRDGDFKAAWELWGKTNQ